MEDNDVRKGEVFSHLKQWGLVVCDLALFVILFFLVVGLLGLPLVAAGLDRAPRTVEEGMYLSLLNEGLMLVSVVVSAWVVLRLRRLPLSVLGFSTAGRWKDWLAGLLLAAVLYAVGFGVSLLAGAVEVTGFAGSLPALLLSLSFFLLVAVCEELMMRGFVLGRMLEGGFNRYVALGLSSLLFSLFHLFNPNFAFLPFLNIFLAGVLLGASYLFTRNLCFPIALHWFWNWFQGPVLGYKVSGNDFGESLLSLRLSDATLLNGGSFGFEGSLLCSVLLVAGIVLVLGYCRKHYGKEE